MASRLLSICVFAAMQLSLAAIFLYAPTEREMGDVQRIFYFHVPAAMTAFAAFFVVFIASIAYLKTREVRWDRVAIAAAELGVLFSTINLVTGPLWAKPVWGVYWRWEPRLTTMLITFAMYIAYLMVRAYASGQGDQMRRFASVLGIVAFVNIPLVHYSVDLWLPEQQLHPQRGIEIAPEMALTKYLCYLAFGLLFFYLLQLRVEMERSAAILEEVRFRRHQSEL